MRFRDRHHEEENRQPGQGPGDGPDGDGLDAIRSAGERLLRAGDDAIRRALSGDSLAFLAANRQSGGE